MNKSQTWNRAVPATVQQGSAVALRLAAESGDAPQGAQHGLGSLTDSATC